MARFNFLDFSTLWVAFGFRLFQAAYFDKYSAFAFLNIIYFYINIYIYVSFDCVWDEYCVIVMFVA